MAKEINYEKQINKVLVANRGEIASRVFRTLHQMGICTVAVHAEDDADALHCRQAAERYLLKGKTLADTYLNIRQLVDIALESDCDAIHPGYGFLSENPDFAAAAEESGLIFVGPQAEAIRLMGNKKEARKTAIQAGIPVIEGVTGPDSVLLSGAAQIGYPVMVKAAAGGGGKGMRMAKDEAELTETLVATRREALKYFGNDEVYIEKFLPSPRHIEVQVLGDNYGKVISLFERECSLQRRHQKIIEEAPAPNISQSMREELMQAAAELARHIGYKSAGTVEFLVQDNNFYFLEMNTRIQVEHPVTEMITGIDIVKEQIQIAAGRPLTMHQEEVKINGHAIEARIYAEDPANNFMPSPGKVLWHKAPEGTRLRIDSAFDGPGEVSSRYDPMISKVIFHAGSRETCRKKIMQHLKNYVILGVKTNLSYLIDLLDSPAFTEGKMHTRLIDDKSKSIEPANKKPRNDKLLMTMAYLFIKAANDHTPANTWQQLGHWRLLPGANLLINNEPYSRQYIYQSPTEMTTTDKNQDTVFRLICRDSHNMQIEAEGSTHRLHYLADNGEVLFQFEGRVYRVSPVRSLGKDTLRLINENPVLEGDSLVKAPMHGSVISVMVKPGDLVNKGDTLLILESMKMENKISATAKAYVKKVDIKAGDVVADNSPLVLLTNKL